MSALSDWLERRAAQTPRQVALVDEAGEITYAGLRDAVRGAAAALAGRHGIARGDRVALLALNRPEYLVLLFACARLGAMLVPLNWRLAAPEHRFILADSGAKLLIHDPAFAATAALAAAELPGIACHPLPAGPFAPSEGDAADPAVDAGTRLLIVYTSGTTGHPKGAVLTQGALLWNAVNAIAAHDLSSRDRVLTPIPMFHVGGLNMQTVPALHAGATVVIQQRFDPAATLAVIRDRRITITVLVPAQLAALVEHPDWAAADLSSLRAITTGSSVVPPHLIEPWHARGVPVINIYGATETAPIATCLAPADAARKIGSCGKAALHGGLRVVDAAGRDVAPGERGEVWVRGPNVMLEYWNNPAATADALRDGWFRTGDIGHLDDEGFLYIDDRSKDVIISGGENIYPAEVEAVLGAMPTLAEVALVAQPHPRWGEVPVAVVVPRPGTSVTEADIQAFLDGRIARFKQPRAVRVVDALPRNAMGKVQKFRLREML